MTDLANYFDPSSFDWPNELLPIVPCSGKGKPDRSWLARDCGLQALGRQSEIDQADPNLAVLIILVGKVFSRALNLAVRDDNSEMTHFLISMGTLEAQLTNIANIHRYRGPLEIHES